MNQYPGDRLIQLLRYDRESGRFFWKEFRSGCKASLVAGGLDGDGYIQIWFERRLYKCHRLAWRVEHGTWPSKALDHIDGDKANNRIENLREATKSQNEANKAVMRTSRTGIKGVRRVGDRFRAQIKHNGKSTHLGLFQTKEEAANAYRAKAIQIHGEFVHQSVLDAPIERRT